MNLETEILDQSIRLWLVAIGITIGICAICVIARWIAVRQLERTADRTFTAIDDAALAAVRSVHPLLILLIAIYIGSRHLALPDQLDTVLRGVAVIAAFAQVGLLAAALLHFWIQRSQARALRENPGAATGLYALGFVARMVLWAIVLLLALDNLGVNVTALIAGLGIGGIAIALAVQNILGDLLASLSIVIDKPFVIGDFIVVDDYSGTVEHVGVKTTRIRSLSGEELIFANGDLLKARLHNYKRMSERRIQFDFGVHYRTPVERVERIGASVRSIIERQPMTRFDRAHFKGFGESRLDFEVVYWMRDPDYNRYMDTQQAINVAMMRAFEREGIEFAYPTRTLMLDGPVPIRALKSRQDLPSKMGKAT